MKCKSLFTVLLLGAVFSVTAQVVRPAPASSNVTSRVGSFYVAPDLSQLATNQSVNAAINNFASQIPVLPSDLCTATNGLCPQAKGGTAEQFLIRNLGLVFKNNYTLVSNPSSRFNDKTPTCGMFAILNCNPQVTAPTNLILLYGIVCASSVTATNPAVAGYTFGSPVYANTYPMADGRFCFTPLTTAYYVADVNNKAVALNILDPKSNDVTSDRFYLHDLYETGFQTYDTVVTVMTQDMISAVTKSLQLVTKTNMTF